MFASDCVPTCKSCKRQDGVAFQFQAGCEAIPPQRRIAREHNRFTSDETVISGNKFGSINLVHRPEPRLPSFIKSV
jgi:hypothetical protein